MKRGVSEKKNSQMGGGPLKKLETLEKPEAGKAGPQMRPKAYRIVNGQNILSHIRPKFFTPQLSDESEKHIQSRNGKGKSGQ